MHAPTGMVALPSNFGNLIPGEIGLVLQSGMMAPSVVTPLFARNIGVTFAVTSGNEVDVDLADYIRYFVDDADTNVIGCFAEQIKRPAEFVEACQVAADAHKPIVMLKIGRSEASQRSAMAHTGSLVGSDAVIDAVLRKNGVTRVASVDEMFEALAILHARRLPRGGGVAAISVSGGAAGLLSDLALDCGVHFADLTPDTRDRLRDVVPEFGNVGNPLDVTGQGVFQPELLQRSLELLACDPGVDSILYARSFPSRLDAVTPAFQALDAAQRTHPDIPILALSLAGGHFFPTATMDVPIQQPLDRLDGVPFLQGAEYGLRAVGALHRYADFLRERVHHAGSAARTRRRLRRQDGLLDPRRRQRRPTQCARGLRHPGRVWHRHPARVPGHHPRRGRRRCRQDGLPGRGQGSRRPAWRTRRAPAAWRLGCATNARSPRPSTVSTPRRPTPRAS